MSDVFLPAIGQGEHIVQITPCRPKQIFEYLLRTSHEWMDITIDYNTGGKVDQVGIRAIQLLGMLALANPQTRPTRNLRQVQLSHSASAVGINTPTLSYGFQTTRRMMGAAGFEPATAWSEAKYSVQTELSALTCEFPSVPYKSLDLHRFRQPSPHSPRAPRHDPTFSVGEK